MGTVNGGYCLSTLSLLKWMEIAFSCVIIGLIEGSVNSWNAYIFILFTGCFCLVVTFLFLLFYFMNGHQTICNDCPYIRVETLFNFIAAALCFAAFGIAVFDTVKMFQNDLQHHTGSLHVGLGEWRNRMAAIAAFTGMNGILYLMSGSYASRGVWMGPFILVA